MFALGSCIGSFLNVCIYRMPRDQSVVWPRSHCTHCRRKITWRDNIPFVSMVVLGGKCRYCRIPISWRYPVVEGVTGLAAVVVVMRFGFNALAVVYFAFTCALIVSSFIDLEFQIIPDEISLGGLVVGVILSVVLPSLHGTDSRWIALSRSVIGLLVGGGLLYTTGLFGDLVFRKESMGGGDIKLLAMAGSILGWKLVTMTFFIAPVFALIPGIAVLVLKRSHVIPYGPFLSIALLVSLFAGHQILQSTGIDETINILTTYYWHR